jgi:hypothetical protein
MLSPSAQTNISAISTMTATRSGVRAPYVRKGGKLPVRDVTIELLKMHNIRSAEDRHAYEANNHNTPIIEQIKLQYPEQWNAMEGTESKIRAKVGNIITEQFRKNKIAIEQLIEIVAEHAGNNTEQQPEIVVEPEVVVQEEMIVEQEEIIVDTPVPNVIEEYNEPPVIHDIASSIRQVENVGEGMITRLEYAAENATARTLSNIDAKTQELNEKMIASYRELTGELKETIHSYKKKIAKMMDAKILELDNVGVTIEHRVEVSVPVCISITGVVSTIVVFATIGFFMVV